MITISHIKGLDEYIATDTETRLSSIHEDKYTACFELGKLVERQMQLKFDTEESRPGCMG